MPSIATMTDDPSGSAGRALRAHWSHYLIEAGGLGIFMLIAGLAATVLEAPHSVLHMALPNALLRRALMGLAMGGTAAALVYSPWGKRSGAHFNPALTLAFLYARKVRAWDAFFYILAQCIGGVAGVLVVLAICGDAFALAPVSDIVTVPGQYGVAAAFCAEWAISFGLMSLVLYASNRKRWAPYTGVACGVLIALYVTFEAPVSGMSMNPSRTIASALPSGIWDAAWIYFVAPITAMISATVVYRLLNNNSAVGCAKLNHAQLDHCIFICAYVSAAPAVASGSAAESV